MLFRRPTVFEFFGGPYDGRLYALNPKQVRPHFVVLQHYQNLIATDRYILVEDLISFSKRARKVYVHEPALEHFRDLWADQGGLPNEQRT